MNILLANRIRQYLTNSTPYYAVWQLYEEANNAICDSQSDTNTRTANYTTTHTQYRLDNCDRQCKGTSFVPQREYRFLLLHNVDRPATSVRQTHVRPIISATVIDTRAAFALAGLASSVTFRCVGYMLLHFMCDTTAAAATAVGAAVLITGPCIRARMMIASL